MNKKAILKELIKDPQIKALYNEGFDRSVINKLIIESLMEQDNNEEKVAELKGKIRTARSQWKKMEITHTKYLEIKEEIESQLNELKQPALPAPQPKQAQQIVKTGTNYPDYQLEVVNKLRGVAIANPAVLDLISTLNIKEQQAMINHAVDAVDVASSDEDKTQAINNIGLNALYAYLDKARKTEAPTSNAIVLAQPMVDPIADDEVQDLEPEVVDGDKLIGTIITTIQNQLETEEGQAISAIVVSDEQDEKNKLAAITKLVDKVKEEQPAVKQLDNKVIAQEVVKQIEKNKQPEFIARESFDDAFGPVGDAFDEYEEVFGTTPYLGEQARVLDGLKDALEAFQDKALKTAAKDISGGKRRQEDQPEGINEQQEQVDIPKEAKQKSFTLHKEIIKTTKELVNFIGKVTKENINTIRGKNLRNAARKKASELMNFLLEAREMLSSLSDEKDTIEFKESLLREADELSIEELRKRHQQILSNMTKLDRIARTKSAEGEEKKAIDMKYIKPTVTNTLQQIKEMSPSFPSTQRPFGKKGDVGEIKKQVRGIARDVTDIVAKLKGFATTTKERPENIQKLDNYITGAIVILDQYFDLDIDDERLRPYLPPKAKPTDAALNKGGADLKAKVDELVQKYGPKIKEIYIKTKDKNEALSKVFDVVEKAVSKITNNKKQTPVITKQVLKDLLDVEGKILDKIKRGENEGILNNIIRKTKEDINYEITNEEEEQLFKSFAKAVSGKNTKSKIKSAIMNWLNGLDPNTRFADIRNLFKEDQEYSHKEIVSDLSDRIKIQVEDFAKKLAANKTRNRLVSVATGNIVNLIDNSREMKDYFEKEYKNQDYYQAFSSFISTINLGLMDRHQDDSTPQAQDVTWEDDKEKSLELAVNKEVEKQVEEKDIDTENISDQKKEELIQQVLDTPEVQKELKNSDTSDEEVKDMIGVEVENSTKPEEENTKSDESDEDTKLLQQFLDLEVLKPLLKNENLDVVQNVLEQVFLDKQTKADDPDTNTYSEQIHNRLYGIFFAANEGELSDMDNKIFIKSIERDIKKLKEFLSEDYSYIVKPPIDMEAIKDVLSPVLDIVYKIKQIKTALETKDPENIKAAKAGIKDIVEFEYELLPKINDTYSYILDSQDYANSLKKDRQYKIEKVEQDENGAMYVSFKDHDKSKDKMIPWDNIKDNMEEIQEQIQRKLETIIENYINQRKL